LRSSDEVSGNIVEPLGLAAEWWGLVEAGSLQTEFADCKGVLNFRAIDAWKPTAPKLIAAAVMNSLMMSQGAMKSSSSMTAC